MELSPDINAIQQQQQQQGPNPNQRVALGNVSQNATGMPSPSTTPNMLAPNGVLSPYGQQQAAGKFYLTILFDAETANGFHSLN